MSNIHVSTESSDHEEWGWAGTVAQFLELEARVVVDSLSAQFATRTCEQPSHSQVVAWRQSVSCLQTALTPLIEAKRGAREWGIVFEYELPRERGRRPDVVILTRDRLVILEFKGATHVLPEHLDQVEAYARDLHAYHQASHDLCMIPILVMGDYVDATRPDERHSHVVRSGELAALLCDVLELADDAPADLEHWLRADYAPLPTLVAAARTIFRHEPLPSIRRAQSAGIPEALRTLSEAAHCARHDRERHLALVTGVPGAGKTLVGLQFVYSNQFDTADEAKEAVLLSGNGPLVKVLQHALDSKVFVQDVHGFLKQYGGASRRRPAEHIWVYDEAQRAWDAKRSAEKRGHARSEPEDFLLLGASMPDWALMVGLVGEGQEIHLGEEAGLGQWNDAIAASGDAWVVHCPPRLQDLFTSASRIAQSDALDLTLSLRSHLASEVHEWVRALLDGRLDNAHASAIRAQAEGYRMYWTDSLDRAKDYVRERYVEAADSRFGLLASSKAKNLESYGVNNGYNFTKRLREGPWYNDAKDSRFSCTQLLDTATEFQCQGLELDLPLVCWGDDLWWNGVAWESKRSARSTAQDPHALRINSYRVLLSRGRDGVVVFCPNNLSEATRHALVTAGLQQL